MVRGKDRDQGAGYRRDRFALRGAEPYHKVLEPPQRPRRLGEREIACPDGRGGFLVKRRHAAQQGSYVIERKATLGHGRHRLVDVKR